MELTLDEEGYPSEDALDKIASFPARDAATAKELINAIRNIWWMPDWGFMWDGKQKLTLHTGGWSGNESIIRALKHSGLKGNYFWTLYWKAHFVGGHYYFEIK